MMNSKTNQNKEGARKNSIVNFLRYREMGQVTKVDTKRQLQLFQSGKMTMDSRKIDQVKGKIDQDVFAQNLRNQALQKMMHPQQHDLKLLAKVFAINKSVVINGSQLQLIIWYSANRWNMRGISVLQSNRLEGYIYANIDILSRIQQFVKVEDQDMIKIILIQEEYKHYDSSGFIDCDVMRPNNTSTIVLPKALAENFKIFSFMHEVIDHFMEEYNVQNLADLRRLWHDDTGLGASGYIPLNLVRLIVQFEQTLKAAATD